MCMESIDFSLLLNNIRGQCADLILTDPPYAISRPTGFAACGKHSVKRLAVCMEFGEWDTQPIDLAAFAAGCYRVLRQGGTLVCFYDLWKLSHLADALKKGGFKQLRLIIWEKNNPVPLNSRINYLTNAREIAVLAVKGSCPTFHGRYHNGVYRYPIEHSGTRYHPTQKPLKLFCELIQRHSNPGDLVVDPFLGSGTTAVAALQTARRFAGSDINPEYIRVSRKRLQEAQQKPNAPMNPMR